jgi:hypothetical protein
MVQVGMVMCVVARGGSPSVANTRIVVMSRDKDEEDVKEST